MNHVNPWKQLTPEALAALEKTGVSRRQFLKGGTLLVGFSVAGLAAQWGIAPSPAAAQNLVAGPGSPQLDSWLSIAADGSVTAYAGKCELGQGMYTAETQLIAEELTVPFDRVKLIVCDTGLTPDQGTTSAANSTPTNFNQGNLALACATAREALFERASTRLGVSADQLVVKDGVISVKTDPSKQVSYGALMGGKPFAIELNPGAKRKPASEWTVLGKPVPRVEIPALVTGTFEHAQNVRVPGMLHGQVVRPPAVGATLVSVDESSLQGLPGLVKVVVKKNFVGVVTEKPWQAIQAANKLKVTWTPGIGLPSQRSFYEYMRNQKPTRDTLVVDSKDVDQKLASSAKVVKATYLYPYQAHGSLGTSCAVADVQAGKATVWSPTQSVYPVRNTVAMMLGLSRENVHVIFRMGSGCYGINGSDNVTYDAALLSQAVGKPVRVQLRRKDEMAWENYGFPFVMDQMAGLDADGNITAWSHESWFASLGGRPNVIPGNGITGFLVGFPLAEFQPRTPAPPPTVFANGLSDAPSYVTGCVNGQCGGQGTVASQRVLTHEVRGPLFTGPLRAPSRIQNNFASESFMDELAASVRQDPIEYRLRHLSDPRLIDVVKAVAKAANWETRPSPRPSIRHTGIATGRGIASTLYGGNNSYVATIAEVEVNQDTGVTTVKRIFVAADVGPISNPNGLSNQLEGAALQGVSRSLTEEVTWDEQKVTSIDWKTYQPLFLGPNVPKIETVLLNRPDQRAMGPGEAAVSVGPAAIANAIFDATGARIRQVPFTAERVKAALSAPGLTALAGEAAVPEARVRHG